MTERPKVLPQPARMQPNDVKAAIHEKKSQHRLGIQRALRGLVSAMLGSGASFLDTIFSAGGNERKYGTAYRRGVARSTRREAQIIGDLRAFYRQRPRPWRWHGNHQRVRHARGPIHYSRNQRFRGGASDAKDHSGSV